MLCICSLFLKYRKLSRIFLENFQNSILTIFVPLTIIENICFYMYGQRFRRVRLVNERFNASFLPMWHVVDINHHFVSDCTAEERSGGSRGKCTCFSLNYRNSHNLALVRVCSGRIVYIYFVKTLEEHARWATVIA